MSANVKALEGEGHVRWDGAQIEGSPHTPPRPTLPHFLPRLRGRRPGTRRVNTAHSLSSFRLQMIQKISQLYCHHNLLGDKSHVINLPWHFM